MLKVVDEVVVSSGNAAGGPLLDEIVRDGARAMLAAALQAEVACPVPKRVPLRVARVISLRRLAGTG